MEGKTTVIITAIIIFIASVAGLYNLNSAQQEQVQQLELQVQQLEQRPQTAGAAFPIPIPGYYIAAGENGVTGSKIANTSVNDMQLTANAITTNYTTNNSVSITGTTFINASTPGSMVLNRTSLVVVSYSTQLTSTQNASMRLNIDGVEQAPGIVFMGNGSGNLAQNQAHTSYNWVNSSLAAGTHYYNVQANVTGGTLGIFNATLIGVAYPK